MSNDAKKLVWSVIGGGNGGQAMAGHLAIYGCKVRIYDIVQEKVDVINRQGGIYVDGQVNGFGKLEFATTDIAKAVQGADIINIVTPANAHSILAKECAPYLKDGQIIVLHPGSSFGVLEFKNILDQEECKADVLLSETYTLIYAARSKEYGKASILGLKKGMGLAAFPADKTKYVLEILKQPFPFLFPQKNVLHTSLKNVNPIVHPTNYLLNASRIDNKEDFLFYHDGYSPAIGRMAENVDKKRMDLGSFFGLDLVPMTEIYKEMYEGITDNTLYDILKINPAYKEIAGQKTLYSRYLLEDIPFGLIPWISLGKKIGADVKIMETVVDMAQYLLDLDLYKEARTVETLGIYNLNAEELLEYVETGVKPMVAAK